MKPIKSEDFLNAIDYISLEGKIKGLIRGIEINSLNIEKDYLFFALETGKISGTHYAEDAIKRGAIAVVTERELNISPFVRVKDSLNALTEFAKYYRHLFTPNVIGLTGSVGKTTVKEMLHLILGSKYDTVKNRGNLNNHIGVPYSVFGIEDNTEFAIFEMGMNHIGEIKHLANIVKPEIGIITSVSPCHIGYFNGIEEILKAKLELYNALPKGGIFFLNSYDELLRNIRRRRDIEHITIGEKGNYKLSNFKENKDAIAFDINDVHFSIPIIGRFNAVNAALAVAVGDRFGISLKESSSILENYKTTEGRMRILNVGDGIFVIDDTYNANPTAFNNMIDYVKNNYQGEKYAVIGDMLELGEFAEFYHRELGKYLDKADFKMVLYKGDYFDEVKKNIENGTAKKLNEQNLMQLAQNAKKGDVILFKGSRGMQMEKWLEKFLKEFDNDL